MSARVESTSLLASHSKMECNGKLDSAQSINGSMKVVRWGPVRSIQVIG